MGTSRRRRSDRAGRGPIRSPGRPTAGRREHRQRFWKAIARGVSSWDAAREAGVWQPVGTRWFREDGGMPPTNLTPLSGHYLSFPELEEIALLHVLPQFRVGGQLRDFRALGLPLCVPLYR